MLLRTAAAFPWVFNSFSVFLFFLLITVTISQKPDANQPKDATAQNINVTTNQVTEKTIKIANKQTTLKEKVLKNTKPPSMKTNTIFINISSQSNKKEKIVKKDNSSVRRFQNGHRQNDADNENLELPSSDVRDITPDLQSENLLRSVVPQTESRATASAGSPDSSRPSCDKRTHKGCDVSHFERCDNRGSCKCLRGFMRNGQTNKCIAAQFFRGEIAFLNTYTDDLQNQDSQAFRDLSAQLQQVLYAAFESQNLDGILGISVIEIAQGRIDMTFEIALDKRSAPRREDVQRNYMRGLATRSFVDLDDFVKLTGTNLVLGNNTNMATYLRPIIEYNHCVDANHNYCDINAICTHSMRSFTCRCRDGYTDVSIDINRVQGETCVVKCHCRNNGTCEKVNGVVECRCPEWFLGSDCEINGKDLLIICVSVLGGLLVLTILLCLVCVCAVRNRKSNRSSGIGMGSLDTSVVKLPRVWMDGSRPYELPPRDTRRWSYVSEPVRYVDEYMMDDYVHAETLPLPRSNDAKKRYYQAYGNQGYSSSTLNIRSPSRH